MQVAHPLLPRARLRQQHMVYTFRAESARRIPRESPVAAPYRIPSLSRPPRNRLRVAGLRCLVDRPSITGGNMTRMSLPTPTLHTARLRLRPFDAADAN